MPLQVALGLEPLPRRVEGAASDPAGRSGLDRDPNTQSIGVAVEAQDGEQDELFEIAKT